MTLTSPKPSPIAFRWQFSAAITALAVGAFNIALGMADGAVAITDHGEVVQPAANTVHAGAVLTLTADYEPQSFMSSGEDGALNLLAASGAVKQLALHKNKWLEHVAVAPERRQRFYAQGKILHEANSGTSWAQQSTIGGLAVQPGGKRLAVAQYNGVAVYPLNVKAPEPLWLEWKGAHQNCIWQPNGESIITSMLEPALHGWRLKDQAEMRMSGYEARVASMQFVEGGKYLASAGAGVAVCWPFFGGGPWNKTPLTVGADVGGLVTLLAGHPADPLLALAYENGALHLAPLFEGGALPLLPAGGAHITALAWAPDGQTLYAARDDGSVLGFTVESVTNAFRV